MTINLDPLPFPAVIEPGQVYLLTPPKEIAGPDPIGRLVLVQCVLHGIASIVPLDGRNGARTKCDPSLDIDFANLGISPMTALVSLSPKRVREIELKDYGLYLGSVTEGMMKQIQNAYDRFWSALNLLSEFQDDPDWESRPRPALDLDVLPEFTRAEMKEISKRVDKEIGMFDALATIAMLNELDPD